METRAPKVVPLKVPLNILQIWPVYSLRDSFKGTPKLKDTT